MTIKFYVLFRNGTIIEKTSFEEAKIIPYYDYLIKSIEPIEINDPRRYEILGENGERISIRIGDYELIDISDEHSRWSLYQTLTFWDIKNSVSFSTKSEGLFIENFFKSVILFLEKVNQLGSYEAYQNMIKLEELSKDIENLREFNRLKELKIKELQDELKNLKEG